MTFEKDVFENLFIIIHCFAEYGRTDQCKYHNFIIGSAPTGPEPWSKSIVLNNVEQLHQSSLKLSRSSKSMPLDMEGFRNGMEIFSYFEEYFKADYDIREVCI